jgi:NADPH-dependent curcumin reductase CurA
MSESKNRQWILKARPAGKLTGEEFHWNETPIPQLSDGEVLVRTLWLSIDPAHPARGPEDFEALHRWQRAGSLVYKEHVVHGLENAPKALLRPFLGENVGKQLVKVADSVA